MIMSISATTMRMAAARRVNVLTRATRTLCRTSGSNTSRGGDGDDWGCSAIPLASSRFEALKQYLSLKPYCRVKPVSTTAVA